MWHRQQQQQQGKTPHVNWLLSAAFGFLAGTHCERPRLVAAALLPGAQVLRGSMPGPVCCRCCCCVTWTGVLTAAAAVNAYSRCEQPARHTCAETRAT